MIGALQSTGFSILIPGAAFVAIVLCLMIFAWAASRRGADQGATSGSPDFQRTRDRMMRERTQALAIRAAPSAPSLSKVGGEPSGHFASWPRGQDGARMGFVLQLDLTEVRAAGGPAWLPDRGLLAVFHSETDRGRPSQVRVVRADAPDVLVDARPTDGQAVAFEPTSSLPSLDWLDIDPATLELSGSELDELADLPARGDAAGPENRIGGFPSEHQSGSMAMACERHRRGEDGAYPDEEISRSAREWRLLLQLDCDPALGLSWRHGGRLYVFIRERDALRGDFASTVTLVQDD